MRSERPGTWLAAAGERHAARRRGWTCSAVLGTVVGGVGALLLRAGALSGADRAAAAAARHHPAGGLHVVMSAVSVVTGTRIIALVVPGVAAVVSATSRRWFPLLSATAVLLLLAAVIAAGKGFLGSAPSRVVDLGLVEGSAFPSGPMSTAVVAGGLAMLLLRERITTSPRRRLLHLAVAMFAVTVGASQVYLEQHRLSDVLASAALGLALLAALAAGIGPAGAAAVSGPS